jgi:N-acetylornithine carbamoyltransferase
MKKTSSGVADDETWPGSSPDKTGDCAEGLGACLRFRAMTCQSYGSSFSKSRKKPAPRPNKKRTRRVPQGHGQALLNGTPYRIRTCNLLIRSQVLYPVELRVHSFGGRVLCAGLEPVNLDTETLGDSCRKLQIMISGASALAVDLEANCRHLFGLPGLPVSPGAGGIILGDCGPSAHSGSLSPVPHIDPAMPSPTSPRHLVRLHDLNADELNDLLDLSGRLRARTGRAVQRPLEGQTVGMLFFRGSFRTRVSLETAIHSLGGHPIHLNAESDFWELEHAEGAVMDGRSPEHIKDAAAVLSHYVDAIAIRPPILNRSWKEERKDRVIEAWTRHADVPVINMESALWHPLQALGDLLTLRDALGDLRDKRLAISWVQSPQPQSPAPIHSLITAAMRMGMDVSVAHPPGYELDERVLQEARDGSDRELRCGLTQEEAVDGARVIYARSWRSLETWDNPTLAASRLAKHKAWRITEDLMAQGENAQLMHAMPVRRNVEVTDEVLDGHRSLLLTQAENRLHTQKALLSRFLRS